LGNPGRYGQFSQTFFSAFHNFLIAIFELSSQFDLTGQTWRTAQSSPSAIVRTPKEQNDDIPETMIVCHAVRHYIHRIWLENGSNGVASFNPHSQI
jgi:hypothetical protein